MNSHPGNGRSFENKNQTSQLEREVIVPTCYLNFRNQFAQKKVEEWQRRLMPTATLNVLLRRKRAFARCSKLPPEQLCRSRRRRREDAKSCNCSSRVGSRGHSSECDRWISQREASSVGLMSVPLKPTLGQQSLLSEMGLDPAHFVRPSIR